MASQFVLQKDIQKTGGTRGCCGKQGWATQRPRTTTSVSSVAHTISYIHAIRERERSCQTCYKMCLDSAGGHRKDAESYIVYLIEGPAETSHAWPLFPDPNKGFRFGLGSGSTCAGGSHKPVSSSRSKSPASSWKGHPFRSCRWDGSWFWAFLLVVKLFLGGAVFISISTYANDK